METAGFLQLREQVHGGQRGLLLWADGTPGHPLRPQSEFSRIAAELNDSSFVPSAGEVTSRLNFFFRFDGETSGDLTHKLSTDPAPLQTTYNEISTKKNLVGKLAGNDS